MNLSPDFSEFVACANCHEVRFLIVGGYAVAYHGHPRYTKDLDVWVERTAENAGRLVRALEEFGFGGVGLDVSDFLEEGQVIQLGYPPSRIDLLTSVSGLDFADAFPNREVVTIDGVDVPFIALADLRQNKEASGRLQDLADLENLE